MKYFLFVILLTGCSYHTHKNEMLIINENITCFKDNQRYNYICNCDSILIKNIQIDEPDDN